MFPSSMFSAQQCLLRVGSKSPATADNFETFTTIIVEVRPSKFNVSFTDQYFADSQSKTEIENDNKFLSKAGDFRLYEICSLSVPLKCLIQSQTSLKILLFSFSVLIDGRRNAGRTSTIIVVKGSIFQIVFVSLCLSYRQIYHAQVKNIILEVRGALGSLCPSTSSAV